MLLKKRFIIAAIFLYAISVRLFILVISNPIIDDFFISLRVAKNFLIGNGLVYNAGEKIISSTSNFYALICAFFLYLFGESAINYLRIFLIIIDSLNAVMIFIIVFEGLNKLSLKFDDKSYILFSFIAALIYASIPATISANIRGLETSLYIFFIILSLLFIQRDRSDLSFLYSAMASIVRPDGLILTFILFVIFSINKRNLKFSIKGIFLIIIYYLILLIYYHQIIPQSVIAKSYLHIDHLENWKIFLLKFYLSPKALLLGILSILGNFILFRTKYFNIIAIWGIAYAVIFSTLGYWYPWYMSPFTVYYAISIALGIKFLYDRIVIYSSNYKKLIYLIYVIPFFLITQSFYNEIILGKNDSKFEISQKMKVANFINHNSKNNDIISIEALGLVGYYSFNKRFKDLPGLISKDVTDIWKRDRIKIRANFADTLTARKFLKNIEPDLLCLREFELDALGKTSILQDYKIIKGFEISYHSKVRANNNFLNWYILKRFKN